MWKFSSRKLLQRKDFTANTALECGHAMPQEGCARPCYPQVTWPFFEKLPLGWKQGFVAPTAAPDPLQNCSSAALVLDAVLHIVAVQFSLHRQWEEEAPKTWEGWRDRQRWHYSFSEVRHPCHALILKITSFSKWKPNTLCDIHAEFTLLSYLVLYRLILNKIWAHISEQSLISSNAVPFDLFHNVRRRPFLIQHIIAVFAHAKYAENNKS